MHDPGLTLHDWESEWESLDADLRADPAHALSELDRLVTRLLEESGYDVTDPVVVEGDEREVIAEYIAAHDIAVAVELDSSELTPGDVASAISDYRAVFDHLVAAHAAADADRGAAEVDEA
jgi:hypothetical protein